MCPLVLSVGVLWACAAGAASAPPAGTDTQPSDISLCVHAKLPADQISACSRVIDDVTLDKSKLPDVYRLRGVGYLQGGDYASAIRDFSEAINRRPDFADAYQNRGLAEFHAVKLDEALADLNEAIKLNENSAIFYTTRGNILSDMEEFDRAIVDFGKSIGINENYTTAYDARAFAYLHKRMFREAIDDYTKAIGLAPGVPKFYIGRASVKMGMDQLDEAIADLDKAIKIEPTSEALRVRGEAKRLRHDLGGAMADCSRAIELSPGDELARVNRALVLEDKHDYASALADLDQAIAINPSNSLAYANRGKVDRLKGDLDRSLRDLEKAVELSPKDPLALTWLGDTSQAKGEFDKAIQDYDAANHFVSDFIAAIVGRGVSLEAKGDLDRAAAEFERALKLPVNIDRDVAEPAQATAREHLAAVRQAIQVATDKKLREEESRKIALAKPIAPALVNIEPPLPDQGVRVALVIGMSKYESVPALTNPDRDAEGIAATLREIGFNSVTLVEDADRSKLTRALRDFQDLADNADWAMVYYAGHGIEIKGQNYLIPVDARLTTDRDAEDEAVSLDRVLDRIHNAHKLQLVILDACRNNPFQTAMKRGDGTRGVDHQRGLARIEPATPNELVVYAAKDGEVAADGDDSEHSPFAAALMKRLKEPRVEITQVFKNVTRDVFEGTKKQQRPFVYGDALDMFYFNTK